MPSRNKYWIFAPYKGVDQVVARLTAPSDVTRPPEVEPHLKAGQTEITSAGSGPVESAAESLAALPAEGGETTHKDATEKTPVPASGVELPAALPTEGGETAHKEKTSEAPVQPKRRSRRKRDRAENVANKIWGGPPPDHLTDAEIIKQVSKGLKEEYKLSDTDIDSYASTILRATGRRNDNRRKSVIIDLDPHCHLPG